MAFTSIADFFAMGGYGFYVWLAYGISILSLIVLIINTMHKRKMVLKTVKQRIAREQRIKNASNMEGTL
ncbi:MULTISPECIES: heme exporter protein CcmD [Psychromonas]|uniref:heme exporter protein CcmD n=1 Tax=Psychromonas TaxID=67572 RepID=UPI00036F4897|nr:MULTISPECIES: heme exporter protein CcmD [Psychromonas]